MMSWSFGHIERAHIYELAIFFISSLCFCLPFVRFTLFLFQYFFRFPDAAFRLNYFLILQSDLGRGGHDWLEFRRLGCIWWCTFKIFRLSLTQIEVYVRIDSMATTSTKYRYLMHADAMRTYWTRVLNATNWNGIFFSSHLLLWPTFCFVHFSHFLSQHKYIIC